MLPDVTGLLTAGRFADLLPHLDTMPLEQAGVPTRALVVFHCGRNALRGRARFAAVFPIRETAGAPPVIVRDKEGAVVPSRLTRSHLTASPALPPGRVLWAMELEFLADVPGQGWQTYGAVFGFSPDSCSEQAAIFEALPLLPVTVLETECHPGTLPLVFDLA